MSYLTERAAYLKGLAEGLKIDESSNEGKLFSALLDVIEEIADEVTMMEERQDDMSGLLEDLSDLDLEDSDQTDENDLDYFEIQCEKCGNKIYLDEDLLESSEDLKCPVCGEAIEIELDECCDGCSDCDCGCDHDE